MAKLEDLFDIDFESSDNFFAYSKETCKGIFRIQWSNY